MKWRLPVVFVNYSHSESPILGALIMYNLEQFNVGTKLKYMYL